MVVVGLFNAFSENKGFEFLTARLVLVRTSDSSRPSRAIRSPPESLMIVTTIAHPNIALIKYWGKRDPVLNLPAMSSLSITLDGFSTRSTLHWGTSSDSVWIDGVAAEPLAARRVLAFLDLVVPGRPPCALESASDFPASAGLASSSSAFAALALASSVAAGLDSSPDALSILARRGSGSACRSLHGGYVLWEMGERLDGLDSRAHALVGPEHWDLRVIACVVEAGPKALSSTQGMLRSAATSHCYRPFVESAPLLVERAIRALRERDLLALVAAMESSTRSMLCAMWASEPAIRYFKAESIAIIDAVETARREGIPCGWTMDAGPNVKVLCEPASLESLLERLDGLCPRLFVHGVGGPARVESITS